VNTKGDFKEDVALLGPTLPTPKTPASFAYRLDSKEGGKYEWMMITFVPDDAGVCLMCGNICGTCANMMAGSRKDAASVFEGWTDESTRRRQFQARLVRNSGCKLSAAVEQIIELTI
jgi:hypothetical protein